MNTLACSAIHLDGKYPEYRLTAIQYYSPAVSATREQIEGNEVKETEDWAIMFLKLVHSIRHFEERLNC
jgi:hypothetical protein